jgi:RepB DNA-primase from phage plasmid
MEQQQKLPIGRQAAGEDALSMPAGVTRAAEMLEAFRSVGAERYRLTCTDRTGTKRVYREYDHSTLTEKLPVILETAKKRQWNVIVRPLAAGRVTLIQLDDLDREALGRVAPVSFLELETSPGNYQAWVAVTDADKTTTRRLQIGTGSDRTASGATRLAGSLNIKPKYEEGGFPTVELFASAPGATCTTADLHARHLLSALPEEAPRQLRPHAPAARERRRIFPSYERCLLDAPPARNHEGPDRSAADFEFSLIAADRKFAALDIAAKLLEVSEKAASEGRRYAEFTAERATEIVQRRRGNS